MEYILWMINSFLIQKVKKIIGGLYPLSVFILSMLFQFGSRTGIVRVILLLTK